MELSESCVEPYNLLYCCHTYASLTVGFEHLSKSRHPTVLPKHEYSNSSCPVEYILKHGVRMRQGSRVQWQCRGYNSRKEAISMPGSFGWMRGILQPAHSSPHTGTRHLELCNTSIRADASNTKQSRETLVHIPLPAWSGFKEKTPGYCRRPLSPAKICKCCSLGYPAMITTELTWLR